MEAHTITITQERPIVDADGIPIKVGSVLERIEKDERLSCRGVVTQIGLPGVMVRACIIGMAVGDIEIETCPGSYRITNQWSEWRHIPKERQTYRERFRAWCLVPYEHDDNNGTRSHDEGLAIDGILALLPPDAVDWEYGPWPDSIAEALAFLQEHLSEISERNT